MIVVGSCQWSVVRCQLSVVTIIRATDNRPRTTDKLLPLFRRLACHHFFRRHLHGALRSALDDAEQSVMLGLADRAAFGDFHPVAFFCLVLLVVSVQRA